MNVCIVGGGHIGTTLLCYIKHTYPEYWVSLFTRKPERFTETLKCNDIEGNFSYDVKPDCISKDARAAAGDADIVFIALPHFAVEKAFLDIAPFVSDRAMIGVIPGGGGCEFFFGKYFDHNKTLFGFQRVPFTAKVQEYGKETNLKSWKPYSVVGTLQRGRIDDACNLIEKCGLKTQKASNFLEVALTPTNPILHTSRTFELFGKYDKGYEFAEKSKFYVGWTDAASETMFAMDNELHTLLDAMQGIDTSAIKRLSEHYESPTIQRMTAKINSIATFQSVYAPMKEQNGKFVADTDSRMFTEDFPWGLLVIRSYFEFFDIKAPVMDKLLNWYADYMGLDWYENGKLCGKDINVTGAIQKYGITTRSELMSLYCQN
jgi:hypothetical protein